ncbi:MAG: TRAM domain-containing protein [Candidatus Microthrix sp.]|nr:TRAM domain-containing protein [Candidatus Microthrix sp.]
MEQIELRVERPVAGGMGLARRDDGRVVLVDGGLPGELVRVTLSEEQHTTFGEVTEVLEANPERVEVAHCPPSPTDAVAAITPMPSLPCFDA